MTRKIIVTGGSGFIGKVLVRKLKEQGHEVLEYNRAEGKDIVNCEINNKDVDAVFHLASGVSVAESMAAPKQYCDTILYGTYRILEAFKGCRIVNISSNAAAETMSPYAVFKRTAELMTDLYPNTISLRPFHVFGEGEKRRIVHEWARAMITDDDISIFGDGSMERDYTYVEDVADAIISYGFSAAKGTMQLGYGKGTTLTELFRLMSEILDYKKKPIYLPERSNDFRKSISEHVIGGVGFSEGLKRTLEHYIDIYA